MTCNVELASGKSVTPIAGFGERVGREAHVELRFDEFVHGSFVCGFVDVVDDLGALVANEAVVFELSQTLHSVDL